MTSLNDLSALIATIELEARNQDETVQRFVESIRELPPNAKLAFAGDALPEEATPNVSIHRRASGPFLRA